MRLLILGRCVPKPGSSVRMFIADSLAVLRAES